jgi:hypothetical protein
MVRGCILTLFKRDDEIAIGSRIPLTSSFYFCIHTKAVVKPLVQLYAEGWRITKATLPETTNA